MVGERSDEGKMTQQKKPHQWWAIKKKSGKWVAGRIITIDGVVESGGSQLFYNEKIAKAHCWPGDKPVKAHLVED